MDYSLSYIEPKKMTELLNMSVTPLTGVPMFYTRDDNGRYWVFPEPYNVIARMEEKL